LFADLKFLCKPLDRLIVINIERLFVKMFRQFVFRHQESGRELVCLALNQVQAGPCLGIAHQYRESTVNVNVVANQMAMKCGGSGFLDSDPKGREKWA
jgi:hypothetical protein